MDAVFSIYLFLISLFNGIALVNLLTAPRLKAEKIRIKEKYPLISAIIPMRNEENNAENIIKDLIKQNYPNLEIVVVDDDSTDNTWKIVQKFKVYKTIKIIRLAKKNKDWVGKSWALYRGLSLAKGDEFVFVDADVRLHRSAILAGWCVMSNGACDVITSFPSQIRCTLGEELIVPLMTWSHVGHIPLSLVNRSRSPSIAMANGQFIMCKRNAYMKIGGHQAVKSSINEDIELIKKFKASKYRVKILLGNKIVKCRMYKGFFSAQKGFGRSLTHAFNNTVNLIAVVAFWAILFLFPYVISFYDQKYIVIVLGIILHRFITSLTLRERPVFNIVLHPIQMITLIEISLYSLYLTVMHKIEWKGRKIIIK